MKLDQLSLQESVEHLTEQDFFKELGDLNDNVLGGYFSLTDSIETPKDPELQSLTDHILESALAENPHLEEGLKGVNMKTYIKTIFNKHPELGLYLISDLGLASLQKKNYDELSLQDKMKVIALKESFQERSKRKLEPNIQDASGRYNLQGFKTRYRNKLQDVVVALSKPFAGKQWKHFFSVKKTLIKEYGASKDLALRYVEYLEEVKQQVEATKPQELGIGGYVVVAVLALALGALGMKYYQDFMTPSGKELTTIGPIDLGDPELLSSLVSVKQKFSQTISVDKKQFDEEMYRGLGKALNHFQSKKMTISADGILGVEYTISALDGASYIYNPQSQMIEILLPYPNIVVREINPKVETHNRERVHVSEFDDAAFEAVDSIKKNALKDTTKRQALIETSINQTASIFYEIYQPIIESKLFSSGLLQVKGVRVTIQDTDSQEVLEKILTKSQLSHMKK